MDTKNTEVKGKEIAINIENKETKIDSTTEKCVIKKQYGQTAVFEFDGSTMQTDLHCNSSNFVAVTYMVYNGKKKIISIE